jgi:hypothetical protein
MIALSRDITSLRQQASLGLLILLWLHIPALLVFDILLGHGWLVTELLALGLTTAATLCWYFHPTAWKPG